MTGHLIIAIAIIIAALILAGGQPRPRGGYEARGTMGPGTPPPRAEGAPPPSRPSR